VIVGRHRLNVKTWREQVDRIDRLPDFPACFESQIASDGPAAAWTTVRLQLA